MFNYGNTGLSRYAEGGVVPEELTPEGGVGDLFTTMQAAPEERFYFSAPRQQADGGYGNTGYNPNQNGYVNRPPMQTPPDFVTNMPTEQLPPTQVPPTGPTPDMLQRLPSDFVMPRTNQLPDWLTFQAGEGQGVTMGSVEHTNPITGEKVMVESGGYGINPAYIEAQLNNQYVENLGRDIGAPGLEFYQDELNKNMQDASTGKSFDQIVADLDYSGEGQAYVSPAETEAARVQAQTNNLMGAYQSNLGRDIGSEGLSFYSNQLDQYNADPSTGKSMDQIMADLRYSSEGQSYTPPAQMMPSMVNGGGNARDDANQIAAMNNLLAANRAGRIDDSEKMLGGAYVNNDQGDLMNVLRGAQGYGERFVNDLNTGIGNYIDSGGIGGAITTGFNNMFGGGDKQTDENNAAATANAAAGVTPTNTGGIFDYGIGGLVSPYGHRR